LICGHQRPAARVAEQDNSVHAGFFSEPINPYSDFGDGVVKQKIGFSASEPGIPTQESDAAGGTKVCEVMLAEVNVVVGSNYCDRRLTTSGPIVNTLAGMTTGTSSPNNGRSQPNELAFH
jgi:hypothetical protein